MSEFSAKEETDDLFKNFFQRILGISVSNKEIFKYPPEIIVGAKVPPLQSGKAGEEMVLQAIKTLYQSFNQEVKVKRKPKRRKSAKTTRVLAKRIVKPH